MSVILSVGRALPPYRYTQGEVEQTVRRLFSSYPNLERYLSVFANAEIEERYFSVPPDWFRHPHPFPERNRLFLEHAIHLGMEAIEEALSETGVKPNQIDHFLFVSSTGIATPTVDAYLIQKLGMDLHCKRTPIWGLGCAGGTAGLSLALQLAKANPTARILLLAVELAGLTFIKEDLSKSNLIATSLFGEGAAAVLIQGENLPLPDQEKSYPFYRSSSSTLFPQSYDVMGWDLVDEGLKVRFSRDIPAFIRTHMQKEVDRYLASQGLNRSQIHHYLLHPGGKKVVEAYEEALSLTPEETKYARRILRRYGNLSSVTVLFLLKEMLFHGKEGEYGLMAALGPGFTLEQLLLQWKGERLANA